MGKGLKMEETKNNSQTVFPKDIAIEELGFSVRTYNCLKRTGINTLEDLLIYPSDQLVRIRNMGAKSIEEINDFKDGIIVIDNTDVDPNENFESWCSLHRQKIEAIFEQYFDENIDDAILSVRSRNALKIHGFKKISEIVMATVDELKEIENLGKMSVEEIKKTCRYYLRSHKDEIISIFGDGTAVSARMDIPIENMKIDDILRSSDHSEMAKEYIRLHDILIEALDLSKRSFNGLKVANVNSFYDLVLMGDRQIRKLDRLGKKSADEIIEKKGQLLDSMKASIVAYCKSDISALYTLDYIKEVILNLYKTLGFKSLSYRRIKEKFPDEIEDTKIKKAIGQLIKDDKLEYVDFRLFRKYPSFYDVLGKQIWTDEDQRKMIIVTERFNGKTLEEIANMPDFNLTRERVRQIIVKQITRIKNRYLNETGLSFFDEDYYQYLYENYSIDQNVYSEWLGVSDRVYFYLKNTYAKGKNTIEDAVKDENIDVAIKLKIRNYLDRNKIVLGGHLINRKRSDVEDYVLAKYCNEEIHFDEFAELYNKVLEKNNIEFDESLYYTDLLKRTRMNKLASSRKVLWKNGMMLRYYDIGNIDQDDFLNSLGLHSFKNTEVSTLKLLKDYPELMKKYDIRDQYELHNLLKKIVDPEDFNDIDFSRQPIIRFGEFDRERAIFDIISAFSPITTHDLVEYVHSEYGYDKYFIQRNLLPPFDSYYHNGVYLVDFKKIPEDASAILKERLTEDFYFIDDIKKIYLDMFADADVEDINPWTLKSLGFNVYSRYVLQNYPSLEAYFTELFTKLDVYDLQPIRRKFGHIVVMDQVYMDLRKSYVLFEFEPNQIINFRKINKLGVTKEDIEEYCTNVYEYADEGFFTIYSLKNKGFSFELDNLGFDNYFYSSLLFVDPRFSAGKMFGDIILYKGEINKEVTRNSFINFVLDDYDSIDVEELINVIRDEYGLRIERQKILDAANASDKYFDSIMNKIYRNESYYYAEFDD